MTKLVSRLFASGEQRAEAAGIEGSFSAVQCIGV